MALNDLIVRRAKPQEKKYTLSDGRGLILEVRPNGQKYWIVRAWKDGKERRRHIGKYPEMSLKDARARATGIREQVVTTSSDKPMVATFGEIAEEWLVKRMTDKKESYVRTVKLRLEQYILPELGKFPVADVTSGMILQICRNIESRGTIETAARVRQVIGQIFRFAIATDRTEIDPTSALQGALQSRQHKHMATITTPRGIATLIRSIEGYPRVIVRHALMFSALTFCRPGEIRHAEWTEIDFDAAEWRIPAEKMKMRRMHIVPLARQTIELLRALQALTGKQRWLFPSARKDGQPLSDNTVRMALRTMGYTNDDMTPHGFRGMASTRLNEMGWPPDVIERQLAHTERNSVRAAYNHAEYLDERRKMMQAWADYLDQLAHGEERG